MPKRELHLCFAGASCSPDRFSPAVNGWALSACSPAIFAEAVSVQLGIRLAVDGFKAVGGPEMPALQSAMGTFLLCSIGPYVYLLTIKSHNQSL